MAILVSIVYPVVGVAFAEFASLSASNEMRIFWRLAAWLASAGAFAAHLAYEHLQLRTPPLRGALHVAGAVATGAFLLAVWVNVHAHWVVASHQSPLAPWALILFPAVTGVPAFGVALVVMTLLARMRRSRP